MVLYNNTNMSIVLKYKKKMNDLKTGTTVADKNFRYKLTWVEKTSPLPLSTMRGGRVVFEVWVF